MPNHKQRSVIVAIATGHEAGTKTTHEALIRKRLVFRDRRGKVQLTDQGVALARELIPKLFERERNLT
jgi:Mn-dependent DtxR family transcriptional regulator